MKATAITCALLAGTFGFGSLASAQEWRHRDGDRQDHARHEQRAERHDGDRRGTRDRGWNRRAAPDRTWNRGSAWTSPQAAYHTPEYTYNVASPFLAAERGELDGIIEPAATRLVIIKALRALRTKRAALPAKKHGNIPL